LGEFGFCRRSQAQGEEHVIIKGKIIKNWHKYGNFTDAEEAKLKD
jgi:hypothetical protein